MANNENWFEERMELSKLSWLGTRLVPKGVNWWYTLGSATLITFIVLVLTGSFLAVAVGPPLAMELRWTTRATRM